ncbi:MAG: ribosome small subunit-dependent GTPase A [Chloroflexi bacterium]|nr:ribosome small subunit-dependent GTPase A [Chloroflexota bacterium]
MARNKITPKKLARKRARRSTRRGDDSNSGARPGLQTQVTGAGLWDVTSVGGTATVAAIRGQTAVVLRDAGFGERAVNNLKTEDYPDGAVPGDRVEIEINDGAGRIVSIGPRRSKLVRLRAEHGRMALAKEHVIAANIDVAVIVASTTSPPFRARLIDRYLVMCQYGGVEPVICVNKIDLQQPDDAALAIYTDLGVTWTAVSAETGEGMDRLQALLQSKTAVLAGHSGVGKSSIINALTGERSLQVGAVGTDRRGQHTTGSSTMVEWSPDSLLIDTPGIRSLGLWDIDAQTLGWYFPEFADHLSGCRYRDCTHDREPDCAIRVATDAGHIARARFDSYLRMLRE